MWCSKKCQKKSHPSEPHVRCSAKTKKGGACLLHADRVSVDGEPLCHVHDPEGRFRKNVELAADRRYGKHDG